MGKKGGKKGKPMVVSKTKRANHLKQKKMSRGKTANAQKPTHKIYQHVDKNGKMNKSKDGSSIPRPAVKKIKKTPVKTNVNGVKDDNFEADEMMEMMEDEDLAHMSQRNGEEKKGKKRPRRDIDDHTIEEEYDEELVRLDKNRKITRPLLPIKTAEGIVERSVEVDEEAEIDEEEKESPAEKEKEEEPKSVAEIYARRQLKLAELKDALGATSSSIMENPDENMDAISTVLKMYNQLTPDIFITGSKLISASLVELFKDLAPGYEIKQTAKPGEKLKKSTRVVYGNEGRLLKYYQAFLKKLENFFAPIKEGRKEKKDLDESKKRAGAFALQCMADLLVAMPYFNFAKNMVHALIPFTGHKDDDVRLMVCDTFRKLFKEDKRGEISLHAVRQVNHMLKNKRNYQIPSDTLDILLALRIKDVNLDREKEEEIGRHKTLTRKQKLLILSKNERRRHKKIERLEKEIIAAKAEESKETKVKFQTETIKLVFTIYFRILKISPRSGLLSTVLAGLAKFAHTINVDFFTDLVEVLNGLIASEQLDYRQCLHAIQVVLTMLSGQGEALNIDPLYFYAHLYRVLFQLTAGPSNSDVPIALDCLENMLIKRRKKVSVHRVLAFTKRIATLGLQVQHNSSIALLNMLRLLMITHKQTDMLLDLEAASGNGSFLPELEEPEHCNAGSTALWELHTLTRHYHPAVGKLARHLLLKCPTTGNGQLSFDMSRKTPQELHKEYDTSTLAFNPPVAPPSTVPPSWKKMSSEQFHCDELEKQVASVMSAKLHVWNDQLIDQFYETSKKS